VTDDLLLRVVAAGFVSFFVLLVIATFVPPVTATIRSSSAVMLAFVSVLFVAVVAAVGSLVLLNRRN